MVDQTPRIGLPTLVPGQAGKELIHNESLLIADALLCPVVVDLPVSRPPTSPAPGATYVVAAGAIEPFDGHDHQLAMWTSSGWRFADVPVGAAVSCLVEPYVLRRSSAGWDIGHVRCGSVRVGGTQVLGPQQGAISAASGGTTVDTQARSVIAQMLTALRAHGLIAS